LNNLRGEFPIDVFLNFLSEKPEAAVIYKKYKDKFRITDNHMTLHTKTDIETHLLSLTLYDEEQKRAVYKKLLTDWIAL